MRDAMNNRRTTLDQIGIRKPCSADWDSMVGNGEVRFCEHCAKDVHNLSSITRVAAEKLVIESKGQLRINCRLHPDGRTEISDGSRLINKLTRTVSKIAASALAIALTISSSAIAKQ